MFDNYENSNCKNFNASVGRCYPTSFVSENKPFGSEMIYGRGICDTDPIPKQLIKKSCQNERNKSTETVARSIDGAAYTKYPTNRHDYLRENGICSTTEEDYFFEDSGASYKRILTLKEKQRKRNDFKLAGPLTEPPNPGKQMKLGEYCAESIRIGKDFYKDF